MLPGFRFLLATIVLSVAVLIFGLGAAALLRTAHEHFTTTQAWRTPLPPVITASAEPPQPTVALLRVEPEPDQPPLSAEPPDMTTEAVIAPPPEPAPEPAAVAENALAAAAAEPVPPPEPAAPATDQAVTPEAAATIEAAAKPVTETEPEPTIVATLVPEIAPGNVPLPNARPAAAAEAHQPAAERPRRARQQTVRHRPQAQRARAARAARQKQKQQSHQQANPLGGLFGGA